MDEVQWTVNKIAVFFGRQLPRYDVQHTDKQLEDSVIRTFMIGIKKKKSDNQSTEVMAQILEYTRMEIKKQKIGGNQLPKCRTTKKLNYNG